MLANTRFLNPDNAHASDLSRADQFQVQLFMQVFSRQLGGEEERWETSHPLIGEFLKVSHQRHFDMSWKLNLTFLDWVIAYHPTKVTKDFADYHCLRATLNWCHTYHEDIEMRGILIHQPHLNPKGETWIGLKEEQLLDQAKIFKANFEDKKTSTLISYAKFADTIETLDLSLLQWETNL